MKARVFHRIMTSVTARQGGFTLIELMVGMAIGLVLAIVASSTYLYSKQAYNAVSENSQMEENGRFALNLLARNIQTSGFIALDPKSSGPQGPSDLKIRGCDYGMTNPTAPTTAADLACQSSTPASTSPSASISAFYDTDARDVAGAKFQGFDCIGNAPVTVASTTGGSPTYQVKAYFFVSRATVSTPYGSTTMGQLSCAADSTPPGGVAAYDSQPLIPGIQQINATYLMPSTLDPNSAQKRLLASEVETANRWPDVLAVELCVLTKSIQASGNDSNSEVTDCFGNTFTPSPSQSYRRFTSVVKLRNRITS